MNGLKSLQQSLVEEFGKRSIERTEIPSIISDNVNPNFLIRPYQTLAFQLFLNYWEEQFPGKPSQYHQFLFHMATGSGKTLMMAGLMLYLYNAGYRNFLFFVNSTNIIDKTRDNFLNPNSIKYLFAPQLNKGDTRFSIREVANFQSGSPDDMNIVFTTIQGLHLALNTPRENGLTFDDFAGQDIVLISDEAHHINTDTKQGNAPVQEELFASESWETTVQRVFKANPRNVLLEFTATVDFADPNLAAKYKPIMIFDYTLKEFRKDGYSKEVKVLQAELPPFERALQASLLSQYRRKIFEKHRQLIKPVILFKSKSIRESKEFFEKFKDGIESLDGTQLAAIRDRADDYSLKNMFSYFASNDITLDNLAAELRGDFSEDKLIEVNSKEESDYKQIAINSLEDPKNEYRAIFAVDKLNEGWDVLNLFDIVRLYDTRDSKAGKVGKTTMSEAQLIGRGARYCPFKLQPDQAADQRKFDLDLGHELRICEELVYHSVYNPKYIQELNTALQEIGIKAKETRQRTVSLKDSFKATELYDTGIIFLNEQLKYDRKDIKGLDSTLIQKTYTVSLMTGHSQTSDLFAADAAGRSVERKKKDYRLADFGAAVIRKAMQRLKFYEFDNLKFYLPNLRSAAEFITSPRYIGAIKVEIVGLPEQVDNLTPQDKLFAATTILDQISGVIASDKIEFIGSTKFKPYRVKDKITDKTLNFAADEGDDQEFGRSMNNPTETGYHLDLTKRDWFAFDDCFGTSEEKALIKYIDKRYDDLKKRYSDVYLVRNERHFKLYNFDDGRALEPDFVLYLTAYEKPASMYYQVFIEPKGGHLIRQDSWKEEFLLRLKSDARIEQIAQDDHYILWGMPFYNQSQGLTEFESQFDQLINDRE